jgi:hypothetical protein
MIIQCSGSGNGVKTRTQLVSMDEYSMTHFLVISA